MIIAELKKKENIVEYIIYIKQLQDILRANKFDITKIEEIIINKYRVSEIDKAKIKSWYSDLIISMKEENIEKSGDLKFIKEIVAEINSLHVNLLNDKDEIKHKELYRWAEANIKEYKTISKSDDKNDIETCIDALYSLILLRLQNKPISEDTAQAMQTFSNLLANLAANYEGA